MNRCDITVCFFHRRGHCTIYDDTRECRYVSFENQKKRIDMQKIMFSDKFGLTQAVIDGRKTMTRRIVDKVWLNDDGSIYEHSHSRYKIGEEIAVAQRYKDCIDDILRRITYSEDKNAMRSKLQASNGWKNKMFVRADLMPHKIKITNIRVERLQGISDDDCFKEGIRYCGGSHESTPDFPTLGFDDFERKVFCNYATTHEAFAGLIDKINGKGTWDSNPWVFVYEFELE